MATYNPNPSLGGHGTSAHVAAQNKKMEESFWAAFSANKGLVVLTKQGKLMVEVMNGGIPKEWGTPTKVTKHLFFWGAINTKLTGVEFLFQKALANLPPEEYCATWTHNNGTIRETVGDCEKFSINTEAPEEKLPTFEFFAMKEPARQQEKFYAGMWAHSLYDKPITPIITGDA